ncbi:mercuric reductase [Tuwongella immobilis]|uniref:Mercuric reductase n=1 Tax=Tuwongella immobilis TaxID=692036 RepID=A0A6C2YKU2_9BACT|nr:mercuric reductase [Tuwongella immobilis]VIP01994.1 mercuric reductase : Pyridine nucleotide-disulphide oxidoreductase dimerisation region OS=Geobacter sp. (strain M21) GN=GM21_0473 PE=3 SV=1: Pyr_redox_2: Pyr_redox: Pyr_redox_dim [Tuwongella immobilis]VTS00069.1 mercuric reductase : Pyridine nucleotide-disulphide oxidoreductase dimerisation region OS=Geobacter sp. (strain M21) GN=GM21_0473 PE=3 SV=1: Pyr_redox_2: Pyr_redox: Pyr_redox_dim [Tuwongella immobilis]
MLEQPQELASSDVEWQRSVRPADWPEPTPAAVYDLVVIGGGTAGLVCAGGAGGLGAKVALIESRLMGGDCLNYGCVPSKAILASARRVGSTTASPEWGTEWGIVGPKPQVDFAAVMNRMRSLRAQLSRHDSPNRFRDQYGVDVFFGHAQFQGPSTLQVGSHSLKFRRAVIASGARATVPEIPGLATSGYHTNETIFSLTQLPPRLVILGGGPIACELGQAFARFGSQVTLLVRSQQLCRREDADISAQLAESLQADGVRIRFGTELRRVEGDTNGQRLTLRTASGEESLESDCLLVAVGRTPNLESLNLSAAGVVHSERGIAVDDHLRTSNRAIFVAGDCMGGVQFTHAADAMARIVIRNALFFGREKFSTRVIPHVTYTQPEIATVGLTQADAQERRIAVDVLEESFAKLDRAVLDGEPNGKLRVLLQAGTDRILGATIIGNHAGDLIAPVIQAMQLKIGLRRIANLVLPYPTQAEIFRKIADAANRQRLTPRSKWILRQILRWRFW